MSNVAAETDFHAGNNTVGGKRRGWRWMVGTSALSIRCTVAAAAALTLVAPAVSWAQEDIGPAVGDSITEPKTGEVLTIVAVFEGAVLTEDNRLVLVDPRIGGEVPDPDNAANFVTVTDSATNAGTGLIEQVTLADGRVIDVSRDVTAQMLARAGDDPLAGFDPLPPADENRNTVSSTSLNGSDGDDGDANILTSQPKDGDNGGTRGGFSATYALDIEAVGTVITTSIGTFGLPVEGIDIRGRGGNGGDGANGTAVIGTTGGDGGNGGTGTRLTVANSGTISTNEPVGTYGIYVRSTGGAGGDGGNGALGVISNGGDAGNGGSGGSVTVTNNASGNITTRRESAHGIYGISLGASGGDGGDGGVGIGSSAGTAGSAGNGGAVTITNRGKVHTLGDSAHGLLGQSIGGSGGDGGDATGFFAYSSGGNRGGQAGTVSLSNEGFLYTGGDDAHGIVAQGVGGGGGASGSSVGVVAVGGSAGSGNSGGNVDVENTASGTIVTEGARAFGMLAQSIGGGGGTAGISAGLVAVGGSGGTGGNGLSAEADNVGLIATFGDGSHGIVTQSIGGGGGAGARLTAGLIVAVGGRGGVGGNGSSSYIDNDGTILTHGSAAHGALVQSIGGGGGNAGLTLAGVAIGGSGSSGGSAGKARFDNSGLVQTSGLGALGVLAQSIGGGGGNGATTGGLIAVGGSGSGGGNAGEVEINNSGNIVTFGDLAHAIVAQSVGGGGGNGGLAASASAFVGVAVGGKGGTGGNGGLVDINFSNRSETIDGVARSLLPVISTAGTAAHGVVAQSVGGGGGNGGTALQATGGLFGAVSVAIGGAGNAGGRGGTVDIDGNAVLLTDGDFSHGLLAQSVGGGGGNGGGVVSIAASAGAGVSGSVAVGVGGSGGAGGDGGQVVLDSGGFAGTSGDYSHALLVQSVGGGGGNGGFAVTGAGAATAGFGVAIPVGVGGSGGAGGSGNLVRIAYAGDLLTQGDHSHGLLAQSVGGAGGNGGFNIAAGVSGGAGVTGAVAIGVGGSGGNGGNGGSAVDGAVDANVTGNIMTMGDYSSGFVAQSVGGSGGNGGYNVSSALSLTAGGGGNVAVGVGGAGGGAGAGRLVTAAVTGDIVTLGDDADAFIAQSLGGGGGNGGVNVTGAVTLTPGAGGNIAVGVGGAGGGGGAGGEVEASLDGTVLTQGSGSQAILVQSLGGGGGNGAVNVTASLTATAAGGNIGVGVGGSGGGAGAGNNATLVRAGDTATQGEDASAIVVQSLGGGGGNGGVNVTAGATLSAGAGATIGVGVGGVGGSGGSAALAYAEIAGAIETGGSNSGGVLVQSLGGGGGNGGVNVTAGLTLSGGASGTVGFGLGGFGGNGGNGGEARLDYAGDVLTRGADSVGIVSQSLGGGGGNGGLNVTGGVNLSSGAGGALSVGIGGAGGNGGGADLASANVRGEIATQGANSSGVLVQSLGGGGGNGGINIGGGVAFSGGTSGSLGVGIGGFGGNGGASSLASLLMDGTVSTAGADSTAITVQSLGGGGGNGALNIAGGLTGAGGSAFGFGVGIGGFGGAGGSAELATATINGAVATTGANSGGVLVQSLGGGGGNGGVNIAGGIAFSSASSFGGSFGLGGFGGGAANGDTAQLRLDAAVSTSGSNADAVVVQSIGGGGGRGGFNVASGLTVSGTGSAIAGAVGVGGFGGEGGNGGQVDATVSQDVAATGLESDTIVQTEDGFALRERLGGSHGVVAQSIGGGGGTGGTNISGGLSFSANADGGAALSLGVGGFGGEGGNGGLVLLSTTSDSITSVGDGKSAVLAQSIGGGGGDGGTNITGGVAVDGTLTVGIGGFGAAGGLGGATVANIAGDLFASGANATGLLAQSIGGGGGNGGVNIAGGISAGNGQSLPALNFAIGGFGAAGSSAAAVTADVDGDTFVSGVGSSGLVAQSIGGGGGKGGLTFALAASTSDDLALSAALGGFGGEGANGGQVLLNSDGQILVDARGEFDGEGVESQVRGNGTGILAQSIGGGGGQAGYNFVGTATNEGVPLTIGIGGRGGAGGAADSVTVQRGQTGASLIQVLGDHAIGLLAQSIGGGGGLGGGNAVFSYSSRAKYEAQLNVGGAGGDGADGAAVTVQHTGTILVTGEHSHALVAQSIGGGGGNAGTNYNVSIFGDQERGKDDKGTIAFDLTVGGGTGDGSDAGAVNVEHDGTLATFGGESTALLAQSIGGGGGNAGSAFSTNFQDDMAFSLAIGRIGGTGGLGGTVDIATTGTISTRGERSHGVHAQSIGGGGGNSSTTAFNAEGEGESDGRNVNLSLELALGLEGGAGSRADDVSVANAASITTAGREAHGLYAQSIGGGGGSGGAAVIDLRQEVLGQLEPSADDAELSLALAVQQGGLGGTGAEGRAVSVTNTGVVATSGEGANAVRAQSIGGGGGDGGAVFNIASPGKKDAFGIEVASGGDGGTGATGGLVTATNLGTLSTTGDDAAALFAQSIGGGGGNGGLAGNLSILRAEEGSTQITLGFNKGGTGGFGGAAGDVIVANGSAQDNAALIATTGQRSYGIHAQSIGGGGGNGGMALSGNYASGLNNVQLGLSLGGSGETGGLGGNVTVDNFGNIETSGDEAHGIFAQSIGGGGGNGALSLVGSVTRSNPFAPNQAMFAMGGSGGEGNDAGSVLVNNFGSIIATGDDAYGILAQSLGGGGGDFSLGITATRSKPVNYIAGTAAAVLGWANGRGGGGEGGDVTVNHTGNIVVSGDSSFGAMGQSVNGGGGGLSLAINSLAGFLTGSLIPGDFVPDDTEGDLADFAAGIPTLSILAGGAGGGDANADRVTMNLTGSIGVVGNYGVAFSQQGIGGGGGQIDLDLNFADMAAGAGSPMGLAMQLGGSEGSGNNGSALESTLTGDLVTQGQRTPGVLLQSIGGGGARSVALLSGDAGRLGELSLVLGGIDQTASAGGTIAYSQTGSIATTGAGSAGAIVQNIGGGGGLMTFAWLEEQADGDSDANLRTTAAVTPTPAMPLDGTLTLGANGGSGLNGGDVDYAMTGDVVTTGDQSIGLVLQSVGAGGGYVDLGNIAGIDITLGGSGGAAGDGGNIALTMDGAVMTAGAASHGLVLQSIGGGGGIVIGDALTGSATLSGGNAGSGGAISLTLADMVVTQGEGAHAIVAQSLGGGGGIVGTQVFGPAGGAGSGGAITLDIDADVYAFGDGANAVFAQSEGGNGGADIVIDIAQGVLVMADGPDAAIAILGGANNAITNNGTLMAMTGLAGTAITGTSGNDVLVNNGLLAGNIDLGGGANSLANTLDARFLSAETLNLGAAGNTFTNAGLLAPGDTSSVVNTALSGSFMQTASGATFAEVDLATQAFDAITATGTVEVSGALDVTLLNPTQFTPGMVSIPVFSGAGGATLGDLDMRADSSVVLNLLGLAQEGNAVVVNYDLTFAPAEALGNRAELGHYLDRVQADGVAAPLLPTFEQLIFVLDAGEYIDLLTQLSGDIYAEQNVAVLQASAAFIERMTDCGSRFGDILSENSRTCVWAEGNLAESDLDAVNGTPAMNSETVSSAGGVVHQLGNDWSASLAVGYADMDLTGHGGAWRASGNGFQLGTGIRRHFGSSSIGLYASYGSFSFDTVRDQPDFGGSAGGERSLDALSAQLVGAHEFALGGFSITPSLAAGLTSFSGGDSVETSSTPNALDIALDRKTHAWVLPQLDLAYHGQVGDGWTLRPFASASLRYYLTDPAAGVQGRFSADTSGVGPFLATVPLGETELAGELGLEMASESGFTLGASYRLQSSSDRDGEILSVRISYPF